MKAQFGIMRFQKYTGPAISSIEAHNERKKEKYASNPDVDTSRSHLNFHLVTPNGRYRVSVKNDPSGRVGSLPVKYVSIEARGYE